MKKYLFVKTYDMFDPHAITLDTAKRVLEFIEIAEKNYYVFKLNDLGNYRKISEEELYEELRRESQD